MTRKLLILLLPIVLSACNLLGSTTNSDNLPEHDLTTDYSRAMNRVFSVTYDTELKNFLD